jgi:hypothetical protein
MPIPSFDDPRSFLDDFGIAVVFTKQGTGAVINKGADGSPLLGVFDEKYVDAKLGDFDMATGGRPCIRCMAADVVAIKKHDSVLIEGEGVYYVDHDPLPDGHGHAFVFVSLDTDVI